MKFLKYIIYCLVVLSAVACAYAEDFDGNPTQIDTNKPTVPLKRRPIVPTTKLPRPRVVDVVERVDGSIMVALSAEIGTVAMVTVTTLDDCASECYLVEGGNVFVLQDVPQGTFEIMIEVDGEVDTYKIFE